MNLQEIQKLKTDREVMAKSLEEVSLLHSISKTDLSAAHLEATRWKEAGTIAKNSMAKMTEKMQTGAKVLAVKSAELEAGEKKWADLQNRMKKHNIHIDRDEESHHTTHTYTYTPVHTHTLPLSLTHTH